MSSEQSVRYTHGHAESVLESHRWRTAANSAAYLIPRLSPGDRLLDVGCGPGTITVDLAQRVAPGQVVGIDASAGVIALARAAAAEAGLESVAFETGDVYALEYPDDAFDVVHAHQVLQHLADPVAALVEMRRVCRPGGLVAVRDADYGAMVWAPADARLDRWNELYRQLARRNGGEPDAGRDLLGWAQAAGFDDIATSAGVWCFATPGERAWWSSTWERRVTESALADQLVETGLATAAELSELAAGWRAWSSAPNGWFAVIHGELICRA
jgi:SAM-dependent methyltransferase